MKKVTTSAFLVSVILLALLVPGGVRPTAAQSQPAAPVAPAPAPDCARVAEALRSSPVMFIENVGQFADDALFQVRGGTGTIWLTDDAIWITLLEQQDQRPMADDPRPPTEDPRSSFVVSCSSGKGVNLKLSFPGANPHPRIEPFDRLDTHVSYFIGNDPDKWHPDVPGWGGVRYVDLYPGVDLEVTSEGGCWTWRMVAHDASPLSLAGGGAGGEGVRLRVEGADALTLDGDCLRLTTALGEFTLPFLTVEGTVPDGQPATFNLEPGTFEVPYPFSPSPPLSVSPQDNPSDLFYATFLGGGDWDMGRDIAVDPTGAAYITGMTMSSNFPATPGAYDTSHNGSYEDAFVAKLSADGAGLLYATFLGGSDFDWGLDIAVDGAGAAYITGDTSSSDFPATPGAYDTSYNGSHDAFVAKLSADGAGLLYATFLGSGYDDVGLGIAVDGAGSAYVAGETWSSNFPTPAGAFDTSFNEGSDAFVVKVNTAGTGLVYATFLGGSDDDSGYAIAVDGSGSAYVTGWTDSSDFPATPGAFDTNYDGSYEDAFVAKLSAEGAGLLYATFLGGSGYDRGHAIAVDGYGAAYITGHTSSSDFPATPGAFDTSYNGSYEDAFVAKLSADGAGLLYATFLGGSDWDVGLGIAVDGAGAAYITGDTSSSDFPATPGAFDTSYNGSYEAFVAKLSADGAGLLYATFLGGSDLDGGLGIAVDGAGAAYITGHTSSSDFPATLGAYDMSHNGGDDAFVAKLAVGGGPPPTYSISGRVTDGSGNPILGVTISDGTGHTATTDSNGNYTLSGLAADTYTITPSKSGYTFSPASRTVSVPPDIRGQDFAGYEPEATIFVPDDYSSIQDAVDAASLGDTIIVRGGTYTENIEIRTDALTIRSENGVEVTEIQATGSGDVVYIEASNVTLDGFSIDGAGLATGVAVKRWNNFADHVMLKNLNIHNCNGSGVDTFCCPSWLRVEGCEIHDNEGTGVASKGYFTEIIRCDIHSNSNGVKLHNSYFFNLPDRGAHCPAGHNLVKGNSIHHNSAYGLYVENSTWDNRTYLNDFFSNNTNVFEKGSGNYYDSDADLDYEYRGRHYTGPLGNFWDDYSGIDTDGDGVGESEYGCGDRAPLVESVKNYNVVKKRPVLLVHGFQWKDDYAPDVEWANMTKILTQSGRMVYVSHYAHGKRTFNSIEEYADNLGDEIDDIKQNEGVSEIDIVAHSMGGLVARAYIEAHDRDPEIPLRMDVHKLVMLGTPNQGVDLAKFYPTLDGEEPAVKEMAPGSEFLRLFNDGVQGPDYTTIAGIECSHCYVAAGMIAPALCKRACISNGQRGYGSDKSFPPGWFSAQDVKLDGAAAKTYLLVNHTNLRKKTEVCEMVRDILSDKEVVESEYWDIDPLWFWLCFRCPVNISVTNSIGQVIDDHNTNEIPNASVDVTSGGTIFRLPFDSSYAISISANVTKTAAFSTTETSPAPNNSTLVNTYNDVTISEGDTASLSIEPNEAPPTMTILSNEETIVVTPTSELVGDVTPPSSVVDLKSDIVGNEVVLTWMAPGDDFNEGTATEYDIRHSNEPITEENWDEGIKYDGVPVPSPQGNLETFAVDRPTKTTYYALKTTDEEDNWSGLSNVTCEVVWSKIYLPIIMKGLDSGSGQNPKQPDALR